MADDDAREAPICPRCHRPKTPYPHDSGWGVCMTRGCWLSPERRAATASAADRQPTGEE